MTSRGGLFIFAKFLDRIGLHKILEKDLSLSIRKKEKQTKGPIISRIYSLILSIPAGFFRMHEIEKLKKDPQFKAGRAGKHLMQIICFIEYRYNNCNWAWLY